MKKGFLISFITLFYVSNLFSQESKFTFTKDGLTDYVITNIEGKTAEELYKNTIGWIGLTNKNPNEVIKAKLENEYISFEGYKPSALCIKLLNVQNCNDIKYQIEVSFKDGKYKFDVVKVEDYTQPIQGVEGGWSVFPIDDKLNSFYFKKNGKIRPLFKTYPQAVETTFNDLNLSLENFIRTESAQSLENVW